MPSEFSSFLSQVPYIGITIAMWVYFTRQLRSEREGCDKRERERDERFIEALERNTRAIESLGDAVRRS